MRFPTMWYVRPAKPQIEYFMIVRLLNAHHFEFLSLKQGCRGLSESTLVKMPHCWKSHATGQLTNQTCCLMKLQTQCFPKINIDGTLFLCEVIVVRIHAHGGVM